MRTPATTTILGFTAVLSLGWFHRDARAEDLTAVQIRERNFMVQKVSGSLSEGTSTLISKTGDQRVRETSGLTKLQSNGVDNMRVTRFTSPADISGTVTLLIEHSDRDDDIWIYLPAVKKVRRLVSSNKKDSFVGTDFSYGDVIGHKVEDWNHRLLREELVDQQPCWVIESLPKRPEVQNDSGYSKRIDWIRKDNFVSVKGESYDTAGQLLKIFTAENLRLVEPGKQRWQPMIIESANTQTGHKTVLHIAKFEVDQKVPDHYFTTRYIEREM